MACKYYLNNAFVWEQESHGNAEMLWQSSTSNHLNHNLSCH